MEIPTSLLEGFFIEKAEHGIHLLLQEGITSHVSLWWQLSL